MEASNHNKVSWNKPLPSRDNDQMVEIANSTARYLVLPLRSPQIRISQLLFMSPRWGIEEPES